MYIFTPVNPRSPFAVANFFLKKSLEDGIPLTPMKLIKLVYIAHGWHLALTGAPLIAESIQAWKYGPVIESLYHSYKIYGNRPLGEDAIAEFSTLDPDDDAIPLLERVWKLYCKFTAAQLSAMTHADGTPWSNSYVEGILGKEIPEGIIRDHYAEKLHANRAKRETSAA